MICMDIGYPEAGRLLGLQGAELLIAPSAWIDLDADIWPVHLQARALDNLAFTVGVNRVGSEGHLNFIGQSMLVNPRGQILARLGAQEDICTRRLIWMKCRKHAVKRCIGRCADRIYTNLSVSRKGKA